MEKLLTKSGKIRQCVHCNSNRGEWAVRFLPIKQAMKWHEMRQPQTRSRSDASGSGASEVSISPGRGPWGQEEQAKARAKEKERSQKRVTVDESFNRYHDKQHPQPAPRTPRAAPSASSSSGDNPWQLMVSRKDPTVHYWWHTRTGQTTFQTPAGMESQAPPRRSSSEEGVHINQAQAAVGDGQAVAGAPPQLRPRTPSPAHVAEEAAAAAEAATQAVLRRHGLR